MPIDCQLASELDDKKGVDEIVMQQYDHIRYISVEDGIGKD